MAHSEACQLFIEEQIEEGLEEGKTPYAIGKELSSWVEKLFMAKIPPRTIEQRARRQDATNVASFTTHENNEGNEENRRQENGTFASGTSGNPNGRPGKYEQRDPAEQRPVFNETNDNIEWARWSWNPVTGCLHGCQYCYARDIANRFYKEKFKPTFHPHRLRAPSNTPFPSKIERIGDKNVFVCSMADLFGDWVPMEWINRVFEVVEDSPKWNFLFLTKNPKRMAEIEWPSNAWAGTTVDTQARVEAAEEAFSRVNAKVKFLSCEPLSENLIFTMPHRFNWVIIGARSKSTQCPEMQPDREWVHSLMNQAFKAGCMVYCKPNLKAMVKEYPE